MTKVKKIKKLKINKLFELIFIIISIALIIYNIYKIIIITNQKKENNNLLLKVVEEVKTEKEIIINDNEEEKKEILTYYDIKRLKEINPDTVGWIEIETTNISYPLVQTNNNEYYLNHSFNRTKNINGWVFLNSESNMNLEDKNTVIYAHNTLFKDLRSKYDKKYNTNFKVNIYTEQYKYIYDVFSLYLIEPSKINMLENTLSENDFKKIISSSSIDFNIEVSKDDKIVTLVTCYYDDSKRIITHAKLSNTISMNNLT